MPEEPTLLDRPLIERCLAIQLIVVPFLGMYWGLCEFVLRDPALGRIFNRDVLLLLQRVIVGYSGIWLTLLAVTLWIRRNRPEIEARAIAYITTQLYGWVNVFAAYVLGTVTTPFLVILIGSGLAALLLFPSRIAWSVINTMVVVLLAQEAAQIMGWIPYAPLMNGSPQDSPYVMHVWTILMWFMVGSVGFLVVLLFHLLLKERANRELRLHELTRTDALTGLANRRHFMDELAKEYARAQRYQRPLSCVMIDLDHFKAINDEHGHAVGDAVLCETSRRLANAVRASDVLARYGGEEFVAILPDTDLAGAENVAERCRTLLGESPIDLGPEGGLTVTASFGVAAFSANSNLSPDELLRAADDALYDAKETGRNRVSLSAIENQPPSTPIKATS